MDTKVSHYGNTTSVHQGSHAEHSVLASLKTARYR